MERKSLAKYHLSAPEQVLSLLMKLAVLGDGHTFTAFADFQDEDSDNDSRAKFESNQMTRRLAGTTI